MRWSRRLASEISYPAAVRRIMSEQLEPRLHLVGTIEGSIYLDKTDGLGHNESGPPDRPVVVEALDGGTVAASQTIAADGTFRLSVDPAGRYNPQFVLRATAPDNRAYYWGIPESDALTGYDTYLWSGVSDPAPEMVGTAGPMVINDGVTRRVLGVLSVNWSNVRGLVYNDLNGDGRLTPDTELVGGLTVQLLDAQDTVVATTQTSNTLLNGFMENYRFPFVDAGTYRVKVVLPGGASVRNLPTLSSMNFSQGGLSDQFSIGWLEGTDGSFSFTTVDRAPTWTLAAAPPPYVGPEMMPLGFTIDVTYSDDTAVNAATLSSDNISVTDPKTGHQLPVEYIRQTGSGTTITATYMVRPTVGVWSVLEEGTYYITLGSKPVKDAGGKAVVAANSQTWSFVVDASPPVAVMYDGFVGSADGKPHEIRVLWADDTPLTSIPNHSVSTWFITAELENLQLLDGGKMADVRYAFSSDNGSPGKGLYPVASRPEPENAVTDSAGNLAELRFFGEFVIRASEQLACDTFDGGTAGLQTDGDVTPTQFNGDPAIRMGEGSDAAFSQSIQLPADAAYLSLDYHFSNGGDGDKLEMSVNGTKVYEVVGTSFTGTGYANTGQIPISAFAGQTATIEVRLASTGARNAVMEVDNLAVLTYPITDVQIGGSTKSVQVTVGSKVQTVSLASGQGVVRVQGENVQTATKSGVVSVTGQHLNVLEVNLTQSSSKTALSFKVTGGDGTMSLGLIDVAGAIGAITGPGVNLNGMLRTNGPAKSVTLRDITGALDIGKQGATAAQSVTLKLGCIADAVIRAEIPVASLTAVEWVDTDGNDMLQAPSVAKLAITGRAAKGSLTAKAGDFGAAMSLKSAGTVKIAGSLVGANIALSQVPDTRHKALTSLAVAGAMRDSIIRSAGHIGTVTLGAMRNSSIFAGVSGSVTGLPGSADDFAAPSTASIASVKVSGSAAGGQPAFASSMVAAPILGKAVLPAVSVDNSGAPFGLAFGQFVSVSYKVPGQKTSTTITKRTQLPVTLNDFALRIL